MVVFVIDTKRMITVDQHFTNNICMFVISNSSELKVSSLVFVKQSRLPGCVDIGS